jgi:hypothetical protein
MDRSIGTQEEEALEILALDSILYYGYIFATATIEFKGAGMNLSTNSKLIVAMKIYVICPVRNARKADLKFGAEYVKKLESQGMIVHYPPRDSDQMEDGVGLKVNEANRKAIISSDEIHVIWDPKSYGSHFDLGMAFMLRAIRECPIVVVRPLKRTLRKSYTNVLLALAKNSSL